MEKHFDAELIATEYANQYPKRNYHNLQHAVLYGIITYAKYISQINPWINVNNSLPNPCTHDERYNNLCVVVSDRGHYKYEALAYYGQDVSEIELDPNTVEWHLISQEHDPIVKHSNITHYHPIKPF